MHSSLLQLANKRLKAESIAVNAYWDGVGDADGFPTGKAGDDEVYRARLMYPDGKVFEYPKFGKAVLEGEEFSEDLRYEVKGVDVLQGEGDGVPGLRHDDGKREIMVCTHGARDCRCSDMGRPLVVALREEISKKGLAEKVTVGEIAHVGGHK
jgi:hypothetical protein